ncbi:hypothetical protein RIF29_25468 [Crotalaria pallida]|uniref:Uncharacterized protein n=1 Tax=Crotalaria pallida TaxID=3830 RepID=A0AAN9HXI4_CROPI
MKEVRIKGDLQSSVRLILQYPLTYCLEVLLLGIAWCGVGTSGSGYEGGVSQQLDDMIESDLASHVRYLGASQLSLESVSLGDLDSVRLILHYSLTYCPKVLLLGMAWCGVGTSGSGYEGGVSQQLDDMIESDLASHVRYVGASQLSLESVSSGNLESVSSA